MESDIYNRCDNMHNATERPRKPSPYTDNWAKQLDLLTVLGTDREGQSIEQQENDPNSWEALFDRLVTIQHRLGYKPGWTIHQSMHAGNPPEWYLLKLAHNAGWPGKRWAAKTIAAYRSPIDELPDITKIQWENIDKPERKAPVKIVFRSGGDRGQSNN
jgi:hypothetical protein